MGALLLRRLLVWSVLLLVLIALGFGLVIVWTANEREWYIDSAGVSATLDLALSDAGRWIATAVLGGLMALVVLAFVVELATAQTNRAPKRGPFTEPFPIPATTGHEPERARRSTGVEEPTERVERGRFTSIVVGDDSTQRMERSPGMERETEPVSTDSTAAVDGEPARSRDPGAEDHSESWRRPTDRTRTVDDPQTGRRTADRAE
jgi:hypothetical protein